MSSPSLVSWLFVAVTATLGGEILVSGSPVSSVSARQFVSQLSGAAEQLLQLSFFLHASGNSAVGRSAASHGRSPPDPRARCRASPCMLPREVIAVRAGAFLLRAAACIHVFFFSSRRFCTSSYYCVVAVVSQPCTPPLRVKIRGDSFFCDIHRIICVYPLPPRPLRKALNVHYVALCAHSCWT